MTVTRRRFLVLAGLGTGGLSLAGCLPELTQKGGGTTESVPPPPLSAQERIARPRAIRRATAELSCTDPKVHEWDTDTFGLGLTLLTPTDAIADARLELRSPQRGRATYSGPAVAAGAADRRVRTEFGRDVLVEVRQVLRSHCAGHTSPEPVRGG